MNTIDLTQLTPQQINDLHKQINEVKKIQKPYTIEENDSHITIKISKAHFLNEQKTNQKNGNPYTLLYQIGTKWGMEKIKLGSRNIGLTCSLTEY